MLDKLFNLFRSKKPEVVDLIPEPCLTKPYDVTDIASKELIHSVNFNLIPDPIILNPDGPQVMILIDDIECTDLMYKQDIISMESTYNVTPYKDFKVIKCLGKDAGYIAYKYVVLNGNKVNKGVIDITLGHNVRNKDGFYVDIDGIDIAWHIKECNPNFEFILSTAHTLNTKNTVINKYNAKCEKHFNRPLKDYYLNKNSYRVDRFYMLAYGSKPPSVTDIG